MTTDHFSEFTLAVGFEAEHVEVSVGGDVNGLTAPTLGAMLGKLIDEHHSTIVLDLSAVRSIDSPGLDVITAAAQRLAPGGVLTVRSTSAVVRRALESSGVAKLVHLEASDPDVATLGPEQVPGDESLAVDGGVAPVSADLIRVGTRSSNEVIDAALRLVTSLADATVANADGVSVTLERHGQMATVAASNDAVLRMDGHQYDTGEGPCLAAAAEGRWFHSESLAEETRWPTFTPLALEQGINCILSSPLMTADRPLGALNIYSTSERAFGKREQELAALFATQASGILAAAGADVSEEQLNERWADALSIRHMIAQAQGILMARRQITADNAAAALHRSARDANVTVRHYAAEIVASAGGDATPVG